MEDEIYCKNCEWAGLNEDLVCTDEDEENFIYCPECESNEIDTL